MKLALFDTEGNGLLDTITQMHCAVVEDYKTGERTIFRPENISSLPAHLDTYDGIICHNLLGYDLPVLRKLFRWEYKGKLIDTLLISRTQRPERPSPPGYEATPHSIEAYGIRFGSPKQEHEDWSVFSEDMLSRCIQDVTILRKVYDFLIEEGKGENWREAHRLNHALFYHLQRQEEYGWLVDREHFDYCIRLLDRYIRKIDLAVVPLLPLVTEKLESKKDGEYNYVRKPFKKDGTLTETVLRIFPGGTSDIGGPFSRIAFRSTDLNSNAETKAFLLASGWIPKEWNKDKDGNETSPKLSKQDPFEGIEGRTGKLIARRVQCRHRKSQIEGWISAIRDDGRIGARVAGIASTGRLRHAVIVNVPNQDAFFGEHMRKGFIAKPGYVLVGTDSKGNQMRQLIGRMKALDGVGDVEFEKAELTGDKAKGTDLHSVNQRRAGLASRTLAKNFFYGCILFGAGDKKTAQIMGPGTSIDAAKAKKAEFFTGLPVLRKLLDTEIAKWRATASMVYNWRFKRMEYKNGYITGLDGRPILVEFEKDILVYYLQSDEAIQMAAAYCVLHKWLERAGYKWSVDYGFVIWMHDEWQIECRKEIANEVVKLSNEAIAWAGRYFGIQCPHEGESKVGINWAETH